MQQINHGHAFASSSIVMALLAMTSRAFKKSCFGNKHYSSSQGIQGMTHFAMDSNVHYLDCHVRSLASGHTPWLVHHNAHLDSIKTRGWIRVRIKRVHYVDLVKIGAMSH